MWSVFNMQHIYKLLTKLVARAPFLGGLLCAAIALGPSTSSQSDSPPWKPSSSPSSLRVILTILPAVCLGGYILDFWGVRPERSIKELSTTDHCLESDVDGQVVVYMRGGAVGIVEVNCIAFGKEFKLVSMVDLQFLTLATWCCLEKQRVWKKNVMGSRTSKEEGIVMGEIWKLTKSQLFQNWQCHEVTAHQKHNYWSHMQSYLSPNGPKQS